MAVIVLLFAHMQAVDLRPGAAAGQTHRVEMEVTAHLVLERRDRTSDRPEQWERRVVRREIYDVRILRAEGGRVQEMVARCTGGQVDVTGRNVASSESGPVPWTNRAFRVVWRGPSREVYDAASNLREHAAFHVGQWESVCDFLPPTSVEPGRSWDIPGDRIGWIEVLVGGEVSTARISGNLRATLARVTERDAEIRIEGALRLSPADPGAEGEGRLQFDGTLLFQRDTGRPGFFQWTAAWEMTRPLIRRETTASRQLLEQQMPVRAGEVRVFTRELRGTIAFR